MTVLIFIPFLIATVSAHSQFMSGLMFRDPKAFVATFANADHDAINKVIEMVNGMIQQGEDEVEQAKKSYYTAQDVANAAAGVLGEAQEDLIYKKGELEIKTDEASLAQEIADLKAYEEADALYHMNDAQVVLDDYTYYLEAEDARISRERSVLEQVAEILEGLKANEVPEGRRLLSVPSQAAFLATLASQGLKVDPEAVTKVQISISKLIQDGEDALAAAQKYVADATTSLADATDAYNFAIDCHVAATTVLGEALESKSMYQSAVESATIVHTDAKDAKNLADDDASTKFDTMQSEEARVADENKDLEEVKDLLKGLL